MVFLAHFFLLLFPPLSFIYAAAGLWKSPSRWRKYIPYLIYVFMIGAYASDPSVFTISFDLVRYIPTIEAYGEMSLSEVLTGSSDFLYARSLMFWFFGRIHMPHMVPAISTATVYAVAFYITCDAAEQYHAEKYIGAVILLQITMLPYINLINNVRNVFSISLITLGAYLDIVKEKRNLPVLFCYVFGCLFHLSAFIFVVFRLISKYVKNFFGLVFIIPIVFSSIAAILYNLKGKLNIGGNLGNAINIIINKLYGYVVDRTSGYAVLSLNSITVKFDRIVMIIGMGVALILIYHALKSKKSVVKADSRMLTYVGLSAAITLASNAFAMPNFWRLAAAFYVMVGILLIPYLSQFGRSPSFIRLLIPLYGVLGNLNLLMQFWKCTWFDFGEWIIAFFSTNIMTIVFDLLKSLFTL